MSDRLLQAVTALQSRFGSAALHRAPAAAAARSSGIPDLDALTGIGGWPVGRLSLLAGPPGSGKRTLAQQAVAFATQEGVAVYIDLPGYLDADFLHRLGADLNRLLVVRPKTLKEAMDSARVLARAGADLVCFDLPRPNASALDAELPHLVHRTEEAACTTLLVHEAQAEAPAVRYYASLIVALQRRAWHLHSDGDLAGLEVDAVTVKNRLAPPGRRARLQLFYPGT